MQVIHPAIGDFGVNTRNFNSCFIPVLATQLLFCNPALIFGKLGGVFGCVSRIARFKTIAGNNQGVNANINSNLCCCSRKQFRFKFTQTRDEVTASSISGNCNSSGVTRQFAAPSNIKRLATFGKRKLSVFVRESSVCEFCALLVFLRFECWIFCSFLKEVFKCCLLVSQTLLQRNARHLIEKFKLWFLLDLGKPGVSSNIADLFLGLVVASVL